ncbi:hypothetical protein N9772_05615 [Bacteroidia bacterium]|nr:hypothetical protein [Bacteroidia bacterium]
MKKNYKRNWRFTLKLLAVFGAMLSAGSASAQLSGMYTIDSATARGGTNFQSFEELEDTLDSDGISGVVTIDVLANSGPYDVGSLSLSSLAGFSGANSLTINGNGDTLRGRSNVLEIEDVSNITFNNLVIEKTSGTGNLVIIRDEASNIMFDNCEIISRKSGGFDAYVLIGDNSTDVNTITIQNCKIWNGLSCNKKRRMLE